MRVISDDALALATLYQEAEGESYEGKVAVGEVICNRIRWKYSSDGTVAGTVLRASQFSGWNTNSGNRRRSVVIDDQDPVAIDCARAWREAVGGSNLAMGAVLYFNPDLVAPTWAPLSTFLVKIGHHAFYKPHER